jgi:hypothetical protein
VACSFACSVASLSLVPDHYLPGHHNLQFKVVADHQFDSGELSSICAVALIELQMSPPPFPDGTGVELPLRGKESGRDIPLQTRQVSFGISAARPCAETSPISRLSRFGFHDWIIFSLGQKSLPNAAGIADPINHGPASARVEHCRDNRHAPHAT